MALSCILALVKIANITNLRKELRESLVIRILTKGTVGTAQALTLVDCFEFFGAGDKNGSMIQSVKLDLGVYFVFDNAR